MSREQGEAAQLAREAEGLLDRLRGVYAAFAVDGVRPPVKMRDLFQGWSGSPGAQMSAADQRFLEGVESTLKKLAWVLADLRGVDPERGERCANEAVEQILGARPLKVERPEQWFLIVAETYAEYMLPHLSAEDLRRHWQACEKAIPRHQRLPNQTRLYKTMRRMLREKEKRSSDRGG